MSNPYGSPGNPDDNNGSGDNNGYGDLPSYGDYSSGDPSQGYGQPQDPGNPYGAYPGGADQQFLGGSTLPGAGIRLGGYIIDVILVGIVSFIIGLLFGGYSNDTVSTGTTALLSIISIILWLAYRIGMEVSTGATLGKMALGLKVVDANGNHLTAQASFMRNLWYLVGSLVAIVPFIGWLLSLAVYIALGVTISKDPQKQSYTDKWGNAYVVRSR
jgi:uncharacterized RDD family membrane protein YckC